MLPKGCPHGHSSTARGAPRLIDWYPVPRAVGHDDGALKGCAAPMPPGEVA
ncbi:hypothetical protein [Actinomyces oris]|uniref:hypothetical protein n=1 Tax=Actinomyces oris TaxID=544580 RepID=UPI0028E3C72C|nr:hypothetical protein [Actinomyces oris]